MLIDVNMDVKIHNVNYNGTGVCLLYKYTYRWDRGILNGTSVSGIYQLDNMEYPHLYMAGSQ